MADFQANQLHNRKSANKGHRWRITVALGALFKRHSSHGRTLSVENKTFELQESGRRGVFPSNDDIFGLWEVAWQAGGGAWNQTHAAPVFNKHSFMTTFGGYQLDFRRISYIFFLEAWVFKELANLFSNFANKLKTRFSGSNMLGFVLSTRLPLYCNHFFSPKI